MFAAQFDNVEAVLVLRDYEAKIKNLAGQTALMVAARNKSYRCADALLKHECNVTDPSGFLFVEYFPDDTNEKYLDNLQKLLASLLKNYAKPE